MTSIISPLERRGSIGYPVGSSMVLTFKTVDLAAQQTPILINYIYCEE